MVEINNIHLKLRNRNNIQWYGLELPLINSMQKFLDYTFASNNLATIVYETQESNHHRRICHTFWRSSGLCPLHADVSALQYCWRHGMLIKGMSFVIYIQFTFVPSEKDLAALYVECKKCITNYISNVYTNTGNT